MRLPYKRSGLRTYFLIIGILSFSSNPFWITLSLPLFFAGLIVRIWAKGCLHQMQEVTIGGPYRFVRHPFYLGNLFLDMSICIMSGFLPLMILGPFLWLAVYIPKMREEEDKMIQKFGQTYKDYRKNVPMLIPFPYKKDITCKKVFSWKNPNILGTELPRSLRFLCYPSFFMITYLARSFDLKQVIPELIVLILSILCFYAISLEIKAFVKQGKSFFRAINPDYLILGAIFFGFFVRIGEFEYDPIIWPLGISMLIFSFYIKNAMTSSLIKSMGLLTIFEIPWFMFLLFPFYISFIVRKISFKNRKGFQYVTLIFGVILGILKELCFS